jgi:hypothetical protein
MAAAAAFARRAQRLGLVMREREETKRAAKQQHLSPHGAARPVGGLRRVSVAAIEPCV